MAPGFVDVHTHDDRLLLSNREMTPKLSQGVTTVITGNCGVSLAPLQIQQPPPPLDLLGGTEWYRFADFATYLAEVERKPPAINAVPLVGHSTLRVGAMDDPTRPAREAEIRRMKEQLRAALAAGAAGLSSGLYYPISRPAPIAEVAALAEELPAFEGIYTTHMRDEGDQVLASLEETFKTGRRAQVPVVISHLKCASPKVWGTSDQVLDRIEAARRQQAVGFDVYPYDAASTVLLPELIEVSKRVLVTWSRSHPEAAGRELSEIAAEWGRTPVEAAERLGPGGAVYFIINHHQLEVGGMGGRLKPMSS